MGYGDFIRYFCILIFFIFSFHLFFTNSGNKFLNLLLGLLLFEELAKLFFLNFLKHIPNYYFEILDFPFILLYLSIPAIFYIYIRSFLNDQTKLGKFDWLHLLPVIFPLIFILFKGIDSSGKFNLNLYLNGENDDYLSVSSFMITSRIILELIYLSLAFKICLKLRTKGSFNFNQDCCFWILFLITLRIVKNLLIIPIFIIQYNYSIKFPNQPHLDLDLIDSLFGFLMALYLLNRPIVKFGFVGLDSNRISVDPPTKTFITGGGSKVTDSESKPIRMKDLSISTVEFSKEITNYMASTKPWLNAEFDISKMASDLGKPLHHCSYTLNSALNTTFRDYVNQFRVDHFISKNLTNANTLTYEAQALESGFKNQSTFYKAFKKNKGVPPKVFFDKLL